MQLEAPVAALGACISDRFLSGLMSQTRQPCFKTLMIHFGCSDLLSLQLAFSRFMLCLELPPGAVQKTTLMATRLPEANKNDEGDEKAEVEASYGASS